MSNSEPHTHFRCKTCFSEVYRIDEKEPISRKPILPFHESCEIEYFTDSERKAFLSNVTKSCHNDIVDNRHSQKWFEHKARIINKMGYGFNRFDFQMLKEETFRKKIERCGKKITRINKGRPPTFRFVDIQVGFERPDVTLLGMRVGEEFEQSLINAKIQYPKLHDIKLKFESDDLYSYLKEKHHIDPNNKGIKIPKIQLAQEIYAKVTVYPKSVVIDIGCTYVGIIYDYEGALYFLGLLERIRANLFFLSESKANIPEPPSWIVTHYHLNKDAQIGYSGKSFEIVAKDIVGGFTRFYSKTFSNGKIARLEQVKTPDRTVKDETEKMKKVSNYVHGKEGERCTPEEAREILNFGDAPLSKNVDKIGVKLTDDELGRSVEDWKYQVAREEFKVKNLVSEDVPPSLPNLETSDQKVQDPPIEHTKNEDAQSQIEEIIEEAEKVPNFDDYVYPKEGEVIGVILTGSELLNNPDWKKFADDPAHRIVMKYDDKP